MSLIHTWIHRAPADAPAVILADGKTLRFGDLTTQPKSGGPYTLEGPASTLARGLIDAALSGNTAFPLPPHLRPDYRERLVAQACAAATPELALIIATSGSSGPPKGVRLNWRAVAAASRMSARALDLRPGDVWLACLPLYHIGGAMILYRCLRAGATTVVHDGFDVTAIARDLVARRITHLSLVPPMLARLLGAGVAPSPHLKCILVGGAAPSDTLLTQARAAGWPVHTSWGMSETGAMLTLDGRPLPGVRVRVGAAGTLEVATPARMSGYLGEGNTGEWLTTHDLGRINADGRVQILGRADDMLISAGINLHPLDIESRLAACPGLREVGITGLADPTWGKLIACAYEGDIAQTALDDWCRAHLAASHRPRRFLRVERLPRLGSGKLDRHALPALWEAHERTLDWGFVAEALARLACAPQQARLLSITLPLSHWPATAHLSTTDGVFWQRPDAGLRMLGLGRACHISSEGAGRFTALQAAHRGWMETWRYHDKVNGSAPPPLAFTGFAFSPQGGTPFPNAALWVPELLLREQSGKTWLTLSCAATEAAQALSRWQAHWQALQAETALNENTPVKHRPDPVADTLFRARGRSALDAIALGLVNKLVLTRTRRLESEMPIPPDAILATLADQQPNCAIYGVGLEGRLFLGASPETLLTLQGDQVGADALAGTAWAASELSLAADKNRREHDFVAHAIAEALAPLCRAIHIPATPEVMQLHGPNALGHLSHLRRRITAQRQPATSAFDLIHRLHPTSAVGGVPREAALDWLARQGDVRSAWYTGGVGWLDATGNCDITVALRCGLIEGCSITLQAGAGFVAGSVVEQEFAETEAKFRTLREALAAVCKDKEPA